MTEKKNAAPHPPHTRICLRSHFGSRVELWHATSLQASLGATILCQIAAREMAVAIPLQPPTPPPQWPVQGGDNRRCTAAEPGQACGRDLRWTPEQTCYGGVLAMQSQTAELHPLPNVGGGDDDWNIHRCRRGIKCTARNCKYFHSDHEKRCRKFSLDMGPCDRPEGGGRCIGGLHVKVQEVNKTLEVNLESTREALDLLRKLEGEPPDARAKYVRITVSGFAMVRRKLLRKFLDIMPLVHELVLPDRANNDHLLLFLTDVVEGCARSSPRLQKVIFEDGSEENLWNSR